MDLMEILKCPVCLGKFNNPKQLPCQHSLCNRPCLEELLRSRNGHFSCPVCKTRHDSPVGGADAVPKCLVLQQLLDVAEKHRETLLSSRKTKAYLASDEINGTDHGSSNVNLSSEEASEIGLSSVCNVCTERGGLCETCLHCGEKLCQQCHEIHLNLVRNAILTYHDHIQLVKTRLEEKQTATRYILSENEEVATDGDIKMLFQLFEQKEHDMIPYFESVKLIIDETFDENNLIAVMFQGEVHLSALSEIEINPAMYKLQTQLERHSYPAASYENRQPSKYRSNHSRNKPVNHNVSTDFVPVVHLKVDLPNPGNRRSGQQNNDMNFHAGTEAQRQGITIIHQSRNNNQNHTKNLRCLVCFIAVMITGIRFGIGIWTSTEGDGIVKIIGSILIAKSVLDLLLIFWGSIKMLQEDIRPNWKPVLWSSAALVNVFLSSSVAILTYAPDNDVSTYEHAQLIVVGIDCVWSGLILISMLILLQKYLKL
ncbi:tripartite motif containing 13-like isoform X2 [Mercenaria mercenaria]|uniref:tripartite motif containing 13-like isoform X2 n=1 Tax=Mercenaria mercenaria TaxID=6596 RepID=UPI00234F8D10|nr:tripartite motif containing 13-like isoform X2 [Mercenaria mercenaria]